VDINTKENACTKNETLSFLSVNWYLQPGKSSYFRFGTAVPKMANVIMPDASDDAKHPADVIQFRSV
jgi:hypothetical protein